MGVEAVKFYYRLAAETKLARDAVTGTYVPLYVVVELSIDRCVVEREKRKLDTLLRHMNIPQEFNVSPEDVESITEAEYLQRGEELICVQLPS